MASRTTKWVIFGVIATILLIGLWVGAFVIAANTGPSFDGEWPEEVVEEGDGNKVAMISVFGEIFSDPEGRTPGATDENILSQLDQATDDPDVKAIILDINSPGGGVVASDTIYRQVKEVRESGTPVVALMRDVAASGGYYIASGANQIVAHPATITGSIGVIMFLPNLTGSAEKLGIEAIVIKSGQFKDIASPFKDMTADERQILQTIIDEAFGDFVGAVSEGRAMDEAEVERLADGRIYTGRQAEASGLVDKLGDRGVAFAEAKSLAATPGATLVRYQRPLGFAESLFGVKFSDPSEELKEAAGLSRDGLNYLWLGP